MSIRFPRIHIAESVQNRLLNFAAGIGSLAPPSAPSVPNEDPKSEELDVKLSEPVTGAAPDDSVIRGVTEGESALSNLVKE